MLKNTIVVGLMTFSSRIFGFVRDLLISATLGAGLISDVFYASLRIANLLRRIFAEGGLNNAFVPIYSKLRDDESNQSAAEFASNARSMLACVLLVITILAEIFMVPIISTLTPGFSEVPGKLELTVELSRIMFPYIVLICIMAIQAAIVNSHEKFAIAAFAPTLFNITLCAAIITWIFIDNRITTHLVRMMSYAVLISGLLQVAVVTYALHRVVRNIRWKIPKLTKPVARLLRNGFPIMAAGVVTQVNVIVGQAIVSSQESAITYLAVADRIYQLPLSLVGVSIGIVLLPRLSRLIRSNDLADANASSLQAIEIAMALIVPAAIAIHLIAGEITTTLFGRGAFDSIAIDGVSVALKYFALGLPAFVLTKILHTIYFSHEKVWQPFGWAMLDLACAATVTITLFPVIGHEAVAIAAASAAWLNCLCMGTQLYRRGYLEITHAFLRRLLGIAIASLALYLFLANLDLVQSFDAVASRELARILWLAVVIVGAVTIYFTTAYFAGGLNKQFATLFLRRSASDK